MVSSCGLGSYFVILVLHSIAAAVLVTVLFTSNLPYNFIVPMLEDLSIFLHSILLFFDIGYASLFCCLLGFVFMTHFALGVFPKTHKNRNIIEKSKYVQKVAKLLGVFPKTHKNCENH